jgi:D-alanine-D-alanine ligase
MRVAILYNPRPAGPGDGPDDEFEEYDGPETTAAIASALEAMGVEPVLVAADRAFPAKLERGGFGFVFNIAEGSGRRCREAVPAAVCEFLGLPFTGSDALTLATTLDKWVARRVVSPDVPVAHGVLIEDSGDESQLSQLAYPVVVKPNDEGSSKGIRRQSLCADPEAAVERCQWLRRHYACPVLAEEYLPGMEITAGVRGNGRSATLIGLMEIAPSEAYDGGAFLYSLETKRDYLRQVSYHVPPRLSAERLAAVEAYALMAYRLLGCRDFARVDFRLDGTGQPRFLECNPLPGLNPHSSDLVILSRVCLAYEELVQGILRDAVGRYDVKL